MIDGGVGRDPRCGVETVGIYVHIPFCVRQCRFCVFTAVSYSGDLIRRYVEALKQEFYTCLEAGLLEGRWLQSIYFGGGTPGLIPAALLSELLGALSRLSPIPQGLEVTLETTPELVTASRASQWRAAGIDRLSIGAQSFRSDELERLGRLHTASQIERAVGFAREAGFSNINLDLIYGLPGQSLSRWRFNLQRAIVLAPTHLSIYGFTLEEGTPFYSAWEQGCLEPPAERRGIAMYRLAQNILAGAGYEQYEVSNFARPGFRCRHNLIYWRDQDYLGLGASAHSYLDGRRWYNHEDPIGYIDKVLKTGRAVQEEEPLDPQRRLREAIAVGLRSAEGVGITALKRRYGRLPAWLRAVITEQTRLGLIQYARGRLRLTAAGILLADEVAIAFMP